MDGTITEHAFLEYFCAELHIMARIKFIIRNMSAVAPQTICATARFGRNEKLMYALPLKCEPAFWDTGRGRVKSTMYCAYRDEINEALDSLERKLDIFAVERVKNGGDVSKVSISRYLDIYFGRIKEKATTFHEFFEDFIETCKTRMNRQRGGQVVTYYTRREYARTLIYIRQYEKERGVYLNFDDIDQDFLASFVGFLQGLNKATNTIAHKVISIKAVMRAANERGLTNNERWKYYRNATEQTEAVALNEEELKILHDFDFSSEPRLCRVRDLFLVGCWTGLRFSDVTRIRKENITDGVISIVQSKTNDMVAIPIHPVFQEIWDKYNGVLPTDISNQKFNDYIKEVCKRVGINERVLKSITRGGKRVTTSYEKWELVSSHTARRSFATNLYRSGFPSISIMQITGHKTETAFLKYIKVSKQEHARLLAEHWKKQWEGK